MTSASIKIDVVYVTLMTMKDTVRFVADLMAVSARTAPKAAGQDFIEAKVLTDSEKDALGQDMIRLGKERQIEGFDRDGKNVLDSDAVLLVGLLPHSSIGLDCGACGFGSCSGFEEKRKAPHDETEKTDFGGPNCVIRLLDLGIALGSAAKKASEMNVDNRIMYRIGVSARRLGLGESNIIHGIPLSATGKSIFFDRQRK